MRSRIFAFFVRVGNFFVGPISRRFLFGIAIAILFIIMPFYAVYLSPPKDFPADRTVTIAPGTALGAVAEDFRREGVVRSAFWFEAFAYLLGGEKGIKAGEYRFDHPRTAPAVARAITSADFGFPSLRVTFPEGTSVREMAALFDGRFSSFDKEAFLGEAKSLEGYLFPDTYFFPANVKAHDVIATLRATFDRRLAAIASEVARFGRQTGEVVTMASLVEEEVRDHESRRIVAGILWKRLDEDMPLQVDAVFPYLIGKNTFELTTDDLAFDSPYNTYRYRGLPPGPITNPGLDALTAAVTPVGSPYWYYLSDREGNMHYAKTFEEHVRNKERYLWRELP